MHRFATTCSPTERVVRHTCTRILEAFSRPRALQRGAEFAGKLRSLSRRKKLHSIQPASRLAWPFLRSGAKARARRRNVCLMCESLPRRFPLAAHAIPSRASGSQAAISSIADQNSAASR